MWNVMALTAWVVSGGLVTWMIYDWIRTDRTHSEAELTSSQEGEIEAISERQQV